MLEDPAAASPAPARPTPGRGVPGRHRRRATALGAAGLLVAGTALVGTVASTAGAAASTPAAAKPTAKGKATAIKPHRIQQGLGAAPAGASGTHGIGDETAALSKRTGRVAVILQLAAPTTSAASLAVRTRGTAAEASAGRSQLATIKTAQARIVSALKAPATSASVLYQVHNVYDGVAVQTDASHLAALRALPGVVAIHLLTPKTPSLTVTDPLIKAPSVWGGTAGVPGDTGAGETIGIVDTGIDYEHTDFGGPGTVIAYQKNDTTIIGDTPGVFPGGKVVGGTDLAGDSYDAAQPANSPATIPHPDPDPEDCSKYRGGNEGHGSHVAGIAGGYGVNTDGSTYTGAYSSATDLSKLQIGPGVAPNAKLYAIRVFGCSGSTNLVTPALDYAADPNGDGDTTDHLDVVNMSLGSSFGQADDPDAVAADALGALGTTVTISAGNDGDVTSIGGSPGTAVSAITVAASDDSQSVTDGVATTIGAAAPTTYAAENSIAYDYIDNPDLTGPVAIAGTGGLPSNATNNSDGCDAFSPAQKAAVAGKVAFLEWIDGVGRRCGSATRSNNAAAAGAVGAILGSDSPTFSAGITGSANIPVALVAKPGADAIRAALTAAAPKAVTVKIGFSERNTGLITSPATVDQAETFTSRGSHAAGGVKPDVSAPGGTVFSAASGTGHEGQSLSGTSMAAPHTAGLAALVRKAHPDYSVEEVKAAIEDTAGANPVYEGTGQTGATEAPNRSGSGRIDALAATGTNLLAFVTDDPGAVGVGFGSVEVPVGDAPYDLFKTVKIENKGTTSASLSLAYAAATELDGASIQLSSTALSVPAGGTGSVDVDLHIDDPTLLLHEIDPTSTVDDASTGIARQFVADISGRLVITPTTGPTLGVPIYAAPKPASDMHADVPAAGVTVPAPALGATTVTSDVPLTGTPVSNEAGADPANGIDGDPTDPTSINSIVTGLELAATNKEAPACAPGVTVSCTTYAQDKAYNLRDVGIGSTVGDVAADPSIDDGSGGYLYVGLTADGPWQTPANNTDYEVSWDVDGDHVTDYTTFNSRIAVGATQTDVLISETVDADGNIVDEEFLNGYDGSLDTSVFDSDSLVLPVAAAALGLTPGQTVGYTVTSYNPQTGAAFDTISGLHFAPYAPAYSLTDGQTLQPSYLDLPSDPTDATTDLPLTVDYASLAIDKPLGIYLIHHHNEVGDKAEVIPVTPTLPTQPTSPPASSTSAAPSSAAPSSAAPSSLLPTSSAPTVIPTSLAPTVAPTSVVPTASLSPSPSPTKKAVPPAASLTFVFGPSLVHSGPHGYKYTITLSALTSGVSNKGRLVALYVDGTRRALLRTGTSGKISFYTSFRKGQHLVTALFFGNNDLVRSLSTTPQRVRGI